MNEQNTSGFYKKNDDGTFAFAPNSVLSPSYCLVRDDASTYTYPVDGWVWADNEDAANALIATSGNVGQQTYNVIGTQWEAVDTETEKYIYRFFISYQQIAGFAANTVMFQWLVTIQSPPVNSMPAHTGGYVIYMTAIPQTVLDVFANMPAMFGTPVIIVDQKKE